jgi:hypothetical protein
MKSVSSVLQPSDCIREGTSSRQSPIFDNCNAKWLNEGVKVSEEERVLRGES